MEEREITGRSAATMLRTLSPPPHICMEGITVVPVWSRKDASFVGTIRWAQALGEVESGRLFVMNLREEAGRSVQLMAEESLIDELRDRLPDLDVTPINIWGPLSELSDVEKVVADLLKTHPFNRRSAGARAAEIVRTIAAYDHKLAVLMMEPNMALHYADLLRFLDAQRRLPERGSLRLADLRNRFIAALGTTTVYRAELYSESRLKQIEQTGLQSAYLSRGGSLSKLAATFQEYGLAYALKKAMRMEAMPTRTPGRLASERLLLSVSIGDGESGDRHGENELAEAIARSVAATFARMHVLDDAGVLESGGCREQTIGRAVALLRQYRIMLIRARVPRFFLYRQVGFGQSVLGNPACAPHTYPSKVIKVRLQDGTWVAIDHANHPNCEGLMENIARQEIDSITFHPLDCEIGYVAYEQSQEDLDESVRLRQQLYSGVDPVTLEPIAVSEQMDEGVQIWRGAATGRTPQYRSQHFAAFASLAPVVETGARRLAMILADMYPPAAFGCSGATSGGREIPSWDGLRTILHNSGLSPDDADQVLMYINCEQRIAGGYTIRQIEKTLPIDIASVLRRVPDRQFTTNEVMRRLNVPESMKMAVITALERLDDVCGLGNGHWRKSR